MATLTLEIANPRDASPRDATRHVFGEEGGSIGRAPSNSWVLTQNKVSGQHAQISFRSGVFYIQDMSRNGVSVNSPDNRLIRNRPYALKAGDRVFIEPYEIDVWIEAESARPTRQPHMDPFAEDPFAPQHDALLPNQNLGAIPASPVNEEVDPLKFFDPVANPAPRKPDPVVPQVDELLGQHYQPPAVVPSPVPPPNPAPFEAVVIPQGYDPLRPDEPLPEPPPPPPPAPPPTPVIRPRPGDSAIRARLKGLSPEDSTIRHRAAPVIAPRPADAEPRITPPPSEPAPRQVDAAPRQAGQTADLGELMSGAGVPDAVITPELSRNLGQIIRIVVAGLMDILQSRQRIKEEFGIPHTMFRPADNNPLKFSANVEDALHNLLVKRNAAYLGPVDAFADAFDDLRDHQLAMLAGLRVAFDAMLTEFDADRLQEAFDTQMSKHALPLIPAKMRYWELYREKCQELIDDPDATFDRLFGDEFRRAYEEQFRQLKAARRTRVAQGPDASQPKK
jgi:predicted component of type VI protein secretion system